MNISNLIIDEEFESVIPPLTNEEFELLKESVLSKDGTVTVRFINGAEISKDKENSNGNGCDSTETENNN